MSATHYLFELNTIPELLKRTVETFPEREAFRQFDHQENAWISTNWRDFYALVMRWRRAFHALGLKPGDRVAMLLTNCLDAVTFDEAALANGLVPVPLHAIDTAGSSAYILQDSGAKFLVTTARARWNAIEAAGHDLPNMKRIVFTSEVLDVEENSRHLTGVEAWLAGGNDVADADLPAGPAPEDLAGLIYTSGTTGRPKGVMVTHANIVANVRQIEEPIGFSENDVFLSYLPFSHTFERTVAHYVSVSHGCAMAFARSVAMIERDLLEVKPTLMCSVPRVYERIYQKIQHEIAGADEKTQYLTAWAAELGWRRFAKRNGLPYEPSEREHLDDTVADMLDEEVMTKIRALFGGKLRATIAGGASLNYTVAQFFSAMGLNILQGYGLTETSPIISVCSHEGNHPATVGFPVKGTSVRLGENDELQVRGPQVMKGYWGKPEETARAFTEDGWFRTGDQADLSDGGRIRIKGRLKEIIVTSTGEKIPPVDLEFAIQADRLFEQVLVLGENRPFIAALVVVNEHLWRELCAEMQMDPDAPETMTDRAVTRLLVKRVRAAAKDFPSYGIPRAIGVLREPFTVEAGLLTPTLKLRRREIQARYADLVESLYAGHKTA